MMAVGLRSVHPVCCSSGGCGAGGLHPATFWSALPLLGMFLNIVNSHKGVDDLGFVVQPHCYTRIGSILSAVVIWIGVPWRRRSSSVMRMVMMMMMMMTPMLMMMTPMILMLVLLLMLLLSPILCSGSSGMLPSSSQSKSRCVPPQSLDPFFAATRERTAFLTPTQQRHDDSVLAMASHHPSPQDGGCSNRPLAWSHGLVRTVKPVQQRTHSTDLRHSANA